MLSKKQILTVGILCSIFTLISAYSIYNFNYLILLAPVVLAIAFASFLALDKLMLATIFFVPLSIKLNKLILHPPFDLDLPTEPILFGITAIFILKYIQERRFDARILKHPVSISIILSAVWSLYTAMTSSMPLVSFKYSVSNLWFLIPFYFIAAEMFKDRKNISRYFTAYLISMLIVIAYTLIHHASYSFGHNASYWVMSPFFVDHTSYGAVLAMLIFIILGVVRALKDADTSKWLYLTALAVLFVALILSYTRAAWLGIVGAAGLWVILTFKIKIKHILIPIAIVGGLLVINKDQIVILMEQNKTDSSADFSQHIKSITNIKSDDSNLERLNRWSCAWRMFCERPIVGFGPGTYMFQYVPFQLSYERSRISTNASDLGNAHSEYLGPLAEQGLVGLLAFLAVIITTTSAAIRVFYHSPHRWARELALYLLLGLVTYYIHGIINNFLDMDKTTALFWAASALIVVLDIYHTDSKDTDISTTV